MSGFVETLQNIISNLGMKNYKQAEEIEELRQEVYEQRQSIIRMYAHTCDLLYALRVCNKECMHEKSLEIVEKMENEIKNKLVI